MINGNELQTLVLRYSSYNSETKMYPEHLGKERLLDLDEHFKMLINKILLSDGPEKEKIIQNYKLLTKQFHPDKLRQFTPEVLWLEHNLSEGQNDGICFKTLSFCYTTLTNPEKFKTVAFEEVKTQDQFKKWLETLKNQSNTYTGRNLYASLLGLLDESRGFIDETGRIKPKGLRALIGFLPVIFSSYGAVIFSEQLFAIYAVYFLMLKGGQYLEQSNFKELKTIGSSLQGMSSVTAAATTTILVRLLEITFWVSRHSLHMSLQVGTAMLKPFLPTASKRKETPQADATGQLCLDLNLAAKNTAKGKHFETPELKLIAAPFERYLGLSSKQLLNNWRAGADKCARIQSVLFSMQLIDRTQDPLEHKLLHVKEIIDQIKNDPKINTKGGKSAAAIETAEQIYSLVHDDVQATQIVVYNN